MNNASEITIVRCASRERFTSISNGILQNESLSCEALAIFVHLLSRPDDWKVSIAQLAKHHRIGRDRVYRALGELRGAGFARLHTPRDPETGRVGKRHWIISEEGFADDRFPENQESGEEPGKLTGFLNSRKADGSPVSWNHRKPVNSGHIQKNYLLQKNDSPQPPKGEREGEDLPCEGSKASGQAANLPLEAPVDAAEAWGRFSAAWTFGLGESSNAARKAFERLSAADREKAIRGTAAFKAAMAGRRHPPHASTYIAERKWACSPVASSQAQGKGAACSSPSASPTALRLPDGRWFLPPGSPQLDRWHGHERATSGDRRARPGCIRPAEWPPSISARAAVGEITVREDSRSKTVPMPEKHFGAADRIGSFPFALAEGQR